MSTPTLEPIWLEGDPPESTRGSTAAKAREAYVAQLRTRPGVWAVYKKYPKSSSASSTVQCFKKLGCDAVSRTKSGECKVYVRWPEQNGRKK